eukprot:12421602-Karenia_brevis.AAC.1
MKKYSFKRPPTEKKTKDEKAHMAAMPVRDPTERIQSLLKVREVVRQEIEKASNLSEEEFQRFDLAQTELQNSVLDELITCVAESRSEMTLATNR